MGIRAPGKQRSLHSKAAAVGRGGPGLVPPWQQSFLGGLLPATQPLPLPLKATPEASFLSGSVCWGGAMSPRPHGDQLPGLVLVWVFLIEVWDPSGCG